MYVTRLPPLLWLILLVAPALTAPLRAHAGQPLLQAHHDLPDSASFPHVGVRVWRARQHA